VQSQNIPILRIENDLAFVDQIFLNFTTMLNQQIGSYKIISKLGEGGMAVVYLAERGTLGKQVALKVLKEDFISNRNVRGRFLSEARKMINLNHPNIVGVQDLIDDGDFVAIELEYIEGKTLKDHLNEKGALPDDEIQHLFKQMLDAIQFVHDKGYVHRDIKPSNFMLSPNGIIKLTDFGIAKNGNDTAIDYTGTGTGMQMGTPKYMSPEQVRNTKDVDYRSDMYSLGVVLWEMVTGKVPYDIQTESTFDVFRKIVDEPLKPTNTKWDAVIEKATLKEVGNRKLDLTLVGKNSPHLISTPLEIKDDIKTNDFLGVYISVFIVLLTLLLAHLTNRL
jgi:serine/threonine protein kinase